MDVDENANLIPLGSRQAAAAPAAADTAAGPLAVAAARESNLAMSTVHSLWACMT